MKSLIQAIDAILPQTQCTQCGYNGCLPYAQAIAQEGEAINRCPPGGDAGIQKLATLLTREVIALDPDCGEHKPLEVAIIEEQHCIGCTLCIQACPVDAIVGANKFMHTVIADLCSGCALCVAPCPVDCIQMIPAEREWTEPDAQGRTQPGDQQPLRPALPRTAVRVRGWPQCLAWFVCPLLGVNSAPPFVRPFHNVVLS